MNIRADSVNKQISKSADKSIGVSGSIFKSGDLRPSTVVSDGISNAMSVGLTSAIQVKDGYFGNPMQRTGTFSPHTMAGSFDLSMITFNRYELTTLYHSCWELRKGVDKVSEDMWSRGVEIMDQEDPTQLKKLYTWFNRLSSEMIYATAQARLFGGAVTLLMVDDGEKDLSKPLNFDRIKKGSVANFYTTDRWYGVTQSTERVTDFRDPDFREPLYYAFQLDGISNDVKVHHTRVLRWINKRTTRMLEVQLQGWGVSELEAALQDLMNYANVKNSSASLVNKALVEIIKLKSLRSIMTGLAGGNPTSSALLAGQMTAINNFRNSNGVALLDADDDYTPHQMSFTGLSDLIDANRPIVAGAFNMPLFFMFGDLKSGVFSSEESPEARMYESFISVRQNEMLYKNVRKLLILGSRLTGIKLMDDFDFLFVPLYDRTEEAKQKELESITDTSLKLMDAGVITRETAFLEIQSAQKRTGYGLHLAERDLNLAKAADKMALENPQDEGDEDEAAEGELEDASNPARKDYNSLFKK